MAATVPQLDRFPIEAHHIKKNKFCMLKGKPCKVMDVKTSKTGKHGHMKCNITGVDVLTQKKYNDVVPGHANMVEFKLFKNEFMVIDVAEDGTTIDTMDKDNKSRTFKVDKENKVHQDLIAAFKASNGKDNVVINVTVVAAPVEISADKYEDVELVESFKEVIEEAK